MTDETSNQPEQGSGTAAPAEQPEQASQNTQDQQQPAGDNAQQSGESSLSNNRRQPDPGFKIKFALFTATVVILMLCLFVKPWQWFGSGEAEKKQPEEEEKQSVSMTSNQELLQGDLPADHPEDMEPDLEKKSEEKKDDDSLGLVPESKSEEPALDSSAQYSPGPAKPSLEDLKFQAPMMGGGSGGSSGSTYARTDTSSASGARAEQQKYPTYDEILEEQRKKMGVNAGGQGSSAAGNFPGAGRPGGQSLESRLQGTPTPVGDTVVNHNRSLMISKGTVIDCILETRLDTTVPGFTSCVIPRDIYSQDGKVLLVERGTKAVGEYQGGVANGLARIFVLWTELRTPEGVIVSIASPAADALGGAGMGGYVDFHWWKRFGNAFLFSMVSSAFDFATAKEADNNGDFQMNDSGMQEIIQEAMRQAGNIPPTLYKNQGEHVSVFVARDIDFSNSYQLSLHH